MRGLVLGQAPPNSLSSPSFWPFDCDSGTRLARYCGAEDRAHLLRSFVTGNLNPRCVGERNGQDLFDRALALQVWDEWCDHVFDTYDRVLVCGAGPAGVVMPRAELLTVYSITMQGKATLLMYAPHPSGGNRWWNDASKRQWACERLRAFCEPVLAPTRRLVGVG